jgi:hypothetical protein
MMRKTFVVLTAIAVTSALSVHALADGPPPASQEQLLVPPYSATTAWTKITDQHNDKMVWFEWIPPDQTTADIRDILTEQIFYALKGHDAAEFVSSVMQRTNGACHATRHNGPYGKPELGYQVAYGQIYCVGNENKDVDIFIKAISGHNALYVVQREFRRPATPGAEPGLTKFTKDQLPEAQARLAAQQAADKYLVDQVKLCPNGIAGNVCAGVDTVADSSTLSSQSPPATSPAALPPASNGSDSVQINGWPVPGTTTADDVREKLGRPTMENHSDPRHVGEYVWVFTRTDGYIFTFLFDKNDHVVRMNAFKHTPPG